MTGPADGSQPREDVVTWAAPKFDTSVKVTNAGAVVATVYDDPDERAFLGLANSMIVSREKNPDLALDLYTWANNVSNQVTDPASRARYMQAMNLELKALDIQHNAEAFATETFEPVLQNLTGNANPTLANLRSLDLNNFFNGIISPVNINGSPRSTSKPNEVQAYGLRLLASKHLQALGSIDSISDANLEAHIGGIVNKNPALDSYIRNTLAAEREHRVADIKSRFEKKELTWQEVDAQASLMADNKLKKGVLDIIKDEKTNNEITVKTTAESARLAGKSADQITTEIVNSAGFLAMPADVREVLTQDLDIKKADLAVDEQIKDANVQKAKSEEWVRSGEELKMSAALWGNRLLKIGKGTLLFGLLGALGGPAFAGVLTGAISASAIASGGVGLSALYGGSIYYPLLYGLIGAGVGTGIGMIWNSYDKALEDERQKVVNTRNENSKKDTAVAKIERDYKLKEINEKVAFDKIYATLFANANKFAPDKVVDAMLKALKYDNLKEVNGMVAAGFA